MFIKTEGRRELDAPVVYGLELGIFASVQYVFVYVCFVQSQWSTKPRTSVSGSCLPSPYWSPGFIQLLKWGRLTRR